MAKQSGTTSHLLGRLRPVILLLAFLLVLLSMWPLLKPESLIDWIVGKSQQFNSPQSGLVTVLAASSESAPVTEPQWQVFLPMVENAPRTEPQTASLQPMVVLDSPTASSATTNTVAGNNALSAKWPAEIQQLGPILTRYAEKRGLDVDLVAAVVFVESWFNPSNKSGYKRCPDGPSTITCRSVSGAIGPMQVMPLHYNSGEDVNNLELNIAKGTRILKSYLAAMGTTKGGLAAYNAGVTGAKNGGGWGYADKVWDIYLQKRK